MKKNLKNYMYLKGNYKIFDKQPDIRDRSPVILVKRGRI